MKTKIWGGIALVLVAVSGFMGYAANPNGTTNGLSSSPVSTEEIMQDIQNEQQQGNVAQHFHVIYMDHTDGEAFAFVSFDVKGEKSYASVLASSTGYDLSVYQPLVDKTVPIRFTAGRGDGFEYVTGIIFNHPDVKSVVIISSNGTATSVPVHNGYFWSWYKHPMTMNTGVIRVIGITGKGDVIQNPRI